jgi:hypothetical protein
MIDGMTAHDEEYIAQIVAARANAGETEAPVHA